MATTKTTRMHIVWTFYCNKIVRPIELMLLANIRVFGVLFMVMHHDYTTRYSNKIKSKIIRITILFAHLFVKKKLGDLEKHSTNWQTRFSFLL